MAKLKAKQLTKGKRYKKEFPWLWLIVGLFVISFGAAFWAMSTPRSPIHQQKLEAAIIDQLYAAYPNEDFTTTVTKELEGYGFQVDIYRGNEVTVDFYRNLPKHNYELIVLRTHSGAIGFNPQDVTTTIGTYLFTNEPYSQTRYLKEQLNDELSIAKIAPGYPSLFAIGPKFVINSMEGNLNNTVVIIDGCSSLYREDLAEAFTSKGASAFLAWNAPVELDYVDAATISLVRNLCTERLTISKAVEVTLATKGADPKSHAVLKYYPRGSGDKTISQLMGNL